MGCTLAFLEGPCAARAKDAARLLGQLVPAEKTAQGSGLSAKGPWRLAIRIQDLLAQGAQIRDAKP